MEMCDLCTVIEKETARGVLATVIEVEGHAYRKAGVSMLLLEDGRTYGNISPGCLESDLLGYVESVLNDDRSRIIEYDMRPVDDLMWGENIGCGGLLVILLEPINDELREVFMKLNSLLRDGLAVALKRLVSKDGAKVSYSFYGQELGSEGKSTPRSSREWAVTDHTTADSLAHTSYIFIYFPKPRLIILGAGDDSIPVAELSAQAGFRVIIADWREALCRADRFSCAEVLTGSPTELVQKLSIGRADYVVLMSHQFQREREFLEQIEGTDCTYLGIMGSKERTSRLTDGLEPFPALRSPVGLKIGAEGPAEIAISIAAELITLKRKQSVPLLCSSTFTQAV